MIGMVVAFNNLRVIGDHGKIPWHCPADLAHFKQITMGKPIIMGRKTHESIGRVLPGRKNIVISRQQQTIDGCEVHPSLQAAILANYQERQLCIIGGGQLYREALPITDRIYFTLIDNNATGDTTFPALNDDEWERVRMESHPADEKNPDAYQFFLLARRVSSA